MTSALYRTAADGDQRRPNNIPLRNVSVQATCIDGRWCRLTETSSVLRRWSVTVDTIASSVPSSSCLAPCCLLDLCLSVYIQYRIDWYRLPCSSVANTKWRPKGVSVMQYALLSSDTFVVITDSLSAWCRVMANYRLYLWDLKQFGYGLGPVIPFGDLSFVAPCVMRVSYTRLCSAETDSSKGLGATTETYTRVTAVHSTPWSIKTCHCIFDYVYFYYILATFRGFLHF